MELKDWLFPDSMEEAKKIQNYLSERVVLRDDFDSVRTIGGLDVSHNLYDPTQMIYGAAVVLSYPENTIMEKGCAALKQKFPYIPGFLGFREAPALVEALEKVSVKPQLLFVDGHGMSHPRGLGIASHIGVGLDMPTIGVAKSILVGEPEGKLGEEVGSEVSLIWKGNEIAKVLRTKKRCLPLIISAGHRISLQSAVLWVKKCLRGYRLPEPTRQAHLAANFCRRNARQI